MYDSLGCGVAERGWNKDGKGVWMEQEVGAGLFILKKVSWRLCRRLKLNSLLSFVTVCVVFKREWWRHSQHECRKARRVAVITVNMKICWYLHVIPVHCAKSCTWCKILEQQRRTLILQIAARGGKWPPANNELVENYLNNILRFIKSINFQQLI
jgi:hypothetical protein